MLAREHQEKANEPRAGVWTSMSEGPEPFIFGDAFLESSPTGRDGEGAGFDKTEFLAFLRAEDTSPEASDGRTQPPKDKVSKESTRGDKSTEAGTQVNQQPGKAVQMQQLSIPPRGERFNPSRPDIPLWVASPPPLTTGAVC